MYFVELFGDNIVKCSEISKLFSLAYLLKALFNEPNKLIFSMKANVSAFIVTAFRTSNNHKNHNISFSIINSVFFYYYYYYYYYIIIIIIIYYYYIIIIYYYYYYICFYINQYLEEKM